GSTRVRPSASSCPSRRGSSPARASSGWSSRHSTTSSLGETENEAENERTGGGEAGRRERFVLRPSGFAMGGRARGVERRDGRGLRREGGTGGRGRRGRRERSCGAGRGGGAAGR